MSNTSFFCSLPVHSTFRVAFFLLLANITAAWSEYPQKHHSTFPKTEVLDRFSLCDHSNQTFGIEHKSAPFRQYPMNNTRKWIKKGILALGIIGSVALIAGLLHPFRRHKNISGNYKKRKSRKIIAFTLLAVTILAVVIPLLGGATGEGGFVWIIIVPAIVLMWLIFLIAIWIGNCKAKKAENNR